MYKLVNILREIQAPDTDKLTADFIEKATDKWKDEDDDNKPMFNYDQVQYIEFHLLYMFFFLRIQLKKQQYCFSLFLHQ